MYRRGRISVCTRSSKAKTKTKNNTIKYASVIDYPTHDTLDQIKSDGSHSIPHLNLNCTVQKFNSVNAKSIDAILALNHLSMRLVYLAAYFESRHAFLCSCSNIFDSNGFWRIYEFTSQYPQIHTNTHTKQKEKNKEIISAKMQEMFSA